MNRTAQVLLGAALVCALTMTPATTSAIEREDPGQRYGCRLWRRPDHVLRPPANLWRPHMAIERTLSIIKPDATKRNLTGKINAKFEEAGLTIVAQKRIHLTKAQAGEFYKVHAERPFYDELCEFMASGPVVVQVLEGEGAIAKNREVMGATNPADAAPGTIRAEFAESVGENSVHGSDAPETAAVEIAFFFAGIEIVLPPGWKTYWRQPMGNGIPPQFDWSGSKNVAQVQLHWPSPEVFETYGMKSAGYEGQVVFPVQDPVQVGAQSGHLLGQAPRRRHHLGTTAVVEGEDQVEGVVPRRQGGRVGPFKPCARPPR